jgi:hypothetical protein
MKQGFLRPFIQPLKRRAGNCPRRLRNRGDAELKQPGRIVFTQRTRPVCCSHFAGKKACAEYSKANHQAVKVSAVTRALLIETTTLALHRRRPQVLDAAERAVQCTANRCTGHQKRDNKERVRDEWTRQKHSKARNNQS